MKDFLKIAGIALLGGAVAALIVVGLVGNDQTGNTGEQVGIVGTRFPNGLAVGTTASVTQNKMTIGNSGTAIGNALFGTCHLFTDSGGAAVSLTASTTKNYDCQATKAIENGAASQSAISGIQANDIVFVHAPTTTPTTSGNNGLLILGYSASTTAGYISVKLFNASGASLTLASSTINNWQYWVVR